MGDDAQLSYQLLLAASSPVHIWEWRDLRFALRSLLSPPDGDDGPAGLERKAEEEAAAEAEEAVLCGDVSASGVSAAQAVLRLLDRCGVGAAEEGEEGEAGGAHARRSAVLHLTCSEWAAEMERQAADSAAAERNAGEEDDEAAAAAGARASLSSSSSPVRVLRLPCLPLALYSALLSSLTSDLPRIPVGLHAPLLSSLTLMGRHVQGDSRAMLQLTTLALRILHAQPRHTPSDTSQPSSSVGLPELLRVLSLVDGWWEEEEERFSGGGAAAVGAEMWQSAMREARRLVEEEEQQLDGSPSPAPSSSAPPLRKALLTLFEWGLSHSFHPLLPALQLVVPLFGTPQRGQAELQSVLSFVHFTCQQSAQRVQEGAEEEAMVESLLSLFVEHWRRPGGEESVLALRRSVELLSAASSASPPLLASPPSSLLFPLLSRCLSAYNQADVTTLPALHLALQLATLAGLGQERQRKARQGDGAGRSASTALNQLEDEHFALLLDLIARTAAAPRYPQLTALDSRASEQLSTQVRQSSHEGDREEHGQQSSPLPASSSDAGQIGSASEEEASVAVAARLLLQLTSGWPSMASSPLHQPRLSVVLCDLVIACVAQGSLSPLSSLLSLLYSLQLPLPRSHAAAVLRALVESGMRADALRLFSRSVAPARPPPLDAVESVLPCLRSELELREWLKALHAAAADRAPLLSTFRALLQLLHSLHTAQPLTASTSIAALTLDSFDCLHRLAADRRPSSASHLARLQPQQPATREEGGKRLLRSAQQPVVTLAASSSSSASTTSPSPSTPPPLPASLFADMFAFACSLGHLPLLTALLRLRAAYGYPLSDELYLHALLPFTPQHSQAASASGGRQRQLDLQPLVSLSTQHRSATPQHRQRAFLTLLCNCVCACVLLALAVVCVSCLSCVCCRWTCACPRRCCAGCCAASQWSLLDHCPTAPSASRSRRPLRRHCRPSSAPSCLACRLCATPPCVGCCVACW